MILTYFLQFGQFKVTILKRIATACLNVVGEYHFEIYFFSSGERIFFLIGENVTTLPRWHHLVASLYGNIVVNGGKIL